MDAIPEKLATRYADLDLAPSFDVIEEMGKGLDEGYLGQSKAGFDPPHPDLYEH